MTRLQIKAEPAGLQRKEGIAAAAERLFSRNAYEAVSIRDIAAEAGVNSALIRYHFGSKEALYRALFARRYHEITNDRITRLKALEIVPHTLASVRAIVRIWTAPLLELAADAASRDFLVLLAREASDTANDHRGIYQSYLDPSAKECIAALARALPGAGRADIVQGYLWMVAAVMSSIAGNRRAARLRDIEAALEPPAGDQAGQLELFAASGIWAMVDCGG